MRSGPYDSTTRGAIAGFARIAFFIPPTGAYCREDRCQSRFRFELIPSLRAPMEECEAAGAIRAVGGEACIVDAPGEELDESAALARLRAFEPDLVVLVVTFATLAFDLALAKRVRESTAGAAIAVRGAPVFVYAEKILEQAPDVDFCVRGEYELVFGALVERSYDEVAGVVVRGTAGARMIGTAPLADELDLLPRPARDLLAEDRYRVRGLSVRQATVRVQRGCPYPCSYCLVETVSGSRPRHRSPESVADEIAEIGERGTRHFYLRADTFSVDRSWAIETAHAIARRAPWARWVTTTRVDCVDEAVVAAMAAGGCYGISFGIDVGSREIGRRVGKRPDLARARRAIELCDRHGILSLGYFMIGFLWETEATLAETAAFARAVRPDLLTVHFAHPYPGTRYHAEVRAAGIGLESLEAQATPAFATNALSTRTLRRAARRMLVRHYADPRVVAGLVRKGSRVVLDRVGAI